MMELTSWKHFLIISYLFEGCYNMFEHCLRRNGIISCIPLEIDPSFLRGKSQLSLSNSRVLKFYNVVKMGTDQNHSKAIIPYLQCHVLRISPYILRIHAGFRQGGNVGVLHRCWLYNLLVDDPLCCEVGRQDSIHGFRL